MNAIRRAWKFWLAEPLTWIFFAFARPKRLEAAFSSQELAFEPEQILSGPDSAKTTIVFETQHRPSALLRLILPLLLVGYILALLSHALLLSIHPGRGNFLDFSLNAGLAVASGLVIGLLFALVFSLREGLVSYLLATLSFSLAVGLAQGDTIIGLIAFVLILGLSGALSLAWQATLTAAKSRF